MFQINSVLNASMHALRFPQKYEAALLVFNIEIQPRQKRACGKISAKWVALNTSPVLSETDECESDNALLCWLLHVSWQFAI